MVLLMISVWVGAMVVLFSSSGNAGAGDGAQGLAGDWGAGSSGQGGPVGNSGNVQDVYVKALGTGFYDKQEVTVKKGVPVRFHFSAERNSGCGRYIIIDGFNKSAVSRNGEEQVMEFTPTKAGRYAYHCSMNMFRGTLVVV